MCRQHTWNVFVSIDKDEKRLGINKKNIEKKQANTIEQFHNISSAFIFFMLFDGKSCVEHKSDTNFGLIVRKMETIFFFQNSFTKKGRNRTWIEYYISHMLHLELAGQVAVVSFNSYRCNGS